MTKISGPFGLSVGNWFQQSMICRTHSFIGSLKFSSCCLSFSSTAVSPSCFSTTLLLFGLRFWFCPLFLNKNRNRLFKGLSMCAHCGKLRLLGAVNRPNYFLGSLPRGGPQARNQSSGLPMEVFPKLPKQQCVWSESWSRGGFSCFSQARKKFLNRVSPWLVPQDNASPE